MSINRSLTLKDLKQNPSLITPEKPNLSYQPLKLIKQMNSRTFNNTSITTLKRALGLEPISPDTKFKKSVLTDLFTQSTSQVKKCKFLIVVAMYNESSEQFSHTLEAVAQNLSYFHAAGIPHTQIACIIIVDGIKPFLQTYNNQKTFFNQFFDEDLAKQRFHVPDLHNCTFPGQQDHDEFAHVFTQQVMLGEAEFPLNLVMCVKHFNKRKLNSHLWFFGGFCELIQPEYVMLLDVGTRPLEGSLFCLYEAMACDKQLAGCCGEIRPMNYDLWKIVVPAQHVEYKFAHMLDKALESVIGYITVLPGAFSAYRWEALQGEPLWEDYFKSICRPDQMDAFQSNIYLAEDRVLCLSLVSKKHQRYTLRYVKKSVADTDVPDSISVLMAQRRRWINGSWFALVDSVRKFRRIFRSEHNIVRKCCFSLQMIYYICSVVYTWFIVGGFCLALTIALKKKYKGNNEVVGDVLILVYISVIIVIFIASLGVKPRRVEDFFKGLAFVLGLYQIYTFYLVASFIVTLDIENDPVVVAITIGSTVGLLGFIVIVNCEVITILKGVLHYVFLIPTYVNIFFIYSICNVHDCTWGNRPDSLTAEEKERLEEFEEFRTRWAIIWALCNSGFAYVMAQLDEADSLVSYYFLSGVILVGIAVIIIRVLGGLIYLFDECFKKSIKLQKSVTVLPSSKLEADNSFCLDDTKLVNALFRLESNKPQAIQPEGVANQELEGNLLGSCEMDKTKLDEKKDLQIDSGENNDVKKKKERRVHRKKKKVRDEDEDEDKDKEKGHRRRDGTTDGKKRRRSKSKRNRNKKKDSLGEKETGEDGRKPRIDFSDFDKIAENVLDIQED